ncbi:hypothetical protein PR048_023871 [Dryococelus australis]|uniref:DUF7869 domain-containing protein n=1 Tax=Dryococelus australis TaxID=614101 RepID=A0ABQ9GVD4_9NEOP|nr:hypothetical protein PR048_023871 [Dryococelus australis]
MALGDVKRRNVAKDISRSQTTFKYHLPVNDKSYNVCKKTVLDVFQISSRRVQTLQTKMKFNLDISDKRGIHHNRSCDVSFDVKELVRDRISSMPAQESHYSKSTSCKLYLSSELCVERMYDNFKESHPNIVFSCSLYREIFRSEFKLRFGPPPSDSCSYCDELYIHLVAAETEDVQKRISAQNTLHHRKTETVYKVLHEDVVMSKSYPKYVVFCTDLQQVLFYPTLHHSSMFYQRQFSTYSQCVHNMGTEKPFMFVWNGSVAKCGSFEVTSCILIYIELHFEPLKVGEIRRLVVWPDRCIAQNYNLWCIALYHYLIAKKYFTTIDQKFLVSGHSFLPCDRDFALIERRKKKSTVYYPKQWLEVIVNASPAFSAYYMDKEDFTNLSAIE